MVIDMHQRRARLLEAASAEFAAHGFAGARVDRICHAAGVNNQAVRGYFGSKGGLFDLVVQQQVEASAEVAPVTPHDLAGYAGRLFAELSSRPDWVRLQRWRSLERPAASPREEQATDRDEQAVAAALSLPVDRARELLAVARSLAHACAAATPEPPPATAVETGALRGHVEAAVRCLVAGAMTR